MPRWIHAALCWLLLAAVGAPATQGASLFSIDFEDQPDGADVTNAYLPLGVRITTDAGGGSGHVRVLDSASFAVSGTKWILPEPDEKGASYLFTFLQPSTLAPLATTYFSIATDPAFHSGETVQLFAYDVNGTQIYSSGTIEGAGGSVTLSVDTTKTAGNAPIHEVRVATNGDPGIGLDDLQFAAVVPEPTASAVASLLLGFLAAASARRRR